MPKKVGRPRKVGRPKKTGAKPKPKKTGRKKAGNVLSTIASLAPLAAAFL